MRPAGKFSSLGDDEICFVDFIFFRIGPDIQLREYMFCMIQTEELVVLRFIILTAIMIFVPNAIVFV